MFTTSDRTSSDDLLDCADQRAQYSVAAGDSAAGQIFDPLAHGSWSGFDDARSAFYPSYVGSLDLDD